MLQPVRCYLVGGLGQQLQPGVHQLETLQSELLQMSRICRRDYKLTSSACRVFNVNLPNLRRPSAENSKAYQSPNLPNRNCAGYLWSAPPYHSKINEPKRLRGERARQALSWEKPEGAMLLKGLRILSLTRAAQKAIQRAEAFGGRPSKCRKISQ